MGGIGKNPLMYKKARGCQIPGLMDIYMDMFGYTGNGTFVDIGAFDCLQWSNTYPLAMAGWGGIFVEPQLDLVGKCEEMFGHRDDIHILNCAVSNRKGLSVLRLAGSLSTIDEETIDTYLGVDGFSFYFQDDPKYSIVTTRTLDSILDNYDIKEIKVLSIDVEGSELAVLEGFSIDKWTPPLVLIEAHEQHEGAGLSAKAIPINDYMDKAGYEKIYSDAINNIYRYEKH